MDEQSIAHQLSREGFPDVYVWDEEPDFVYGSHAHDYETALVLVRGTILLIVNGVERNYAVGERADIPAGVMHSAVVGPTGCRYVVGEGRKRHE